MDNKDFDTISEDTELLFKDLSQRLRYKVKCNVYGRIGTLTGLNDYGAEIDYGNGEDTTCEIQYCLPYLRPISSMTEEEKAKRYDELLLKLQKAKVDDNVCDERYCCVIDDIVPELKESEDEKIRKELICFLETEIPQCNARDKYIAWLEEQKEFVSADFDDVWETADCDELTAPLEKYSKDAIKKMCHAWYDKGIELERRNWLEKQGEPADKVEPKFHEGEWIVWQDKFYKVNYNGCGYELIDQNGLRTSLEYGTVDENAHLWTIQDAKAGDVLYSPKGAGVEGIFLIKGWKQVECTGKTLCSNIGYRVEENEIVVSEPGAIWWEGVVDPFYPATKEQRDTLMKAMADAGYTFDFDKKELKKIEDEIEIPYGAKDSELIEESYNIPKGFHAEIDKDKVVIKKGEKPTWSEMDKTMVRCITSDLELLKNRGDGEASKAAYQGEIKWLKSLKDRVGCEVNCTTTKKWKPSDEQMEAFEHFVRGIGENGYASPYENNTKLLYSLLEQLKKLRGE